jgi:hypothetical protein
MRKLAIISAGTVGFFLGSWSGRGPYEALRRQVDKMLGSTPEGGAPLNERSEGPADNQVTRARPEPSEPSTSSRDPRPSHVAV